MKPAIFLLTLCLCVACKPELPADLILVGGNIYTGDRKNPKASALAVREGKLIYVGDEAGAKKFEGPSTERVNAGGKFVMPGFIEGHGHFAGLGGS
ncbi:MAG TPA: amidohydrolase, partial [Saprospiraceae bacterium]|nr:amidohydrolase [Saprospiraceae bacterium]